jgi:hypothetical protein
MSPVQSLELLRIDREALAHEAERLCEKPGGFITFENFIRNILTPWAVRHNVMRAQGEQSFLARWVTNRTYGRTFEHALPECEALAQDIRSGLLPGESFLC